MKKFDFNKLDLYKKTMNELGLGAMVFDQEPRLQMGYDGESWYIDEFDEDMDKFVALIECWDWEDFKKEVARYFLSE